MRILTFVTSILLTLMATTTAQAHAFLDHAEPPLLAQRDHQLGQRLIGGPALDLAGQRVGGG